MKQKIERATICEGFTISRISLDLEWRGRPVMSDLMRVTLLLQLQSSSQGGIFVLAMQIHPS